MFALCLTPRPAEAAPAAEAGGDDTPATRAGRHAHWKAAAQQSLLFLGVQHAYALTQPKTQRDLHGPFFRD